MDTTNQTALSTTEQLQVWWHAKSFAGKEYCSLEEGAQLRVKPFEQKTMSILNPVTGDAIIQNLIEKFTELNKQCVELEKEWNEASDKLKLMGKINRFHDHIKQTNAIGDFNALLATISQFESEIQGQIEKNYQEKCALVAEAEAMSLEHNNWKDMTQKFKEFGERWKSMGYVDKKRNEELWDKLERIKAKFFEDKRNHQEEIGKEMLQNLDLKMELADKAEALANSENWKETSEIFKQILEEWKGIGKTMPEKNEALWQRIISAKNNFFDRKKIHTDQIKVEQEANYEKKLAIVEKAESIKDSTDWAITTQAYADLMTEWKGIGSVPAEFSNLLWDRFNAAKEVFFNAKRAKTELFKTMLEENYIKKQKLVERVEALKESNNWRATSEEMNLIFEEWKKIGQVAKEQSEVQWEQFIAARKYFFNRKDEDRARRDADRKRRDEELEQQRAAQKQQEEKNKAQRLIDLKKSLEEMIFESTDEEAQIIEFNESLQNISEGPKSEELKKHLGQLVIEIDQRIKNRAPKIERLQAQIAQMELDAQSSTAETPGESAS
jgi:PAS domain-containing protein